MRRCIYDAIAFFALVAILAACQGRDLPAAFASGPRDAAVPSAFICSVLRTERQTYGALCLGRLRPKP